MSALTSGLGGRGRTIRGMVGRFWSALSAVSIKELRGRMRGRRAFAVLTIYLLLLALFAFGIYVYLKQQAAIQTGPGPLGRGGIDAPFPVGQTLGSGTALSAGIGHGIFGGLLFLETLLVLVLAPAFTAGLISLEREKQTLDMLITTPLSTLGMVIGKLLSALSYVFLLILASIPLASLVFVFGGVGPDDLLRGYAFLFALAFGMGAIGLFVSALVKRTQTATVVTFVLVLVLSIGTAGAHQFWQVASRSGATTGSLLTQRPGRAPEALLWLNPFVADLDMVCATAPDSYHDSCEYISRVTGRPYFGAPSTTGEPPVMDPSLPVFEAPAEVPAMERLPGGPGQLGAPAPDGGGGGAPGGDPVVRAQVASLGFPRDTFWPKSAAAFVALGVLLTLVSAQLVSPTRRLRLPRPRRPRRTAAARAIDDHSASATPEALG